MPCFSNCFVFVATLSSICSNFLLWIFVAFIWTSIFRCGWNEIKSVWRREVKIISMQVFFRIVVRDQEIDTGTFLKLSNPEYWTLLSNRFQAASDLPLFWRSLLLFISCAFLNISLPMPVFDPMNRSVVFTEFYQKQILCNFQSQLFSKRTSKGKI